jgi:hypothetical protein
MHKYRIQRCMDHGYRKPAVMLEVQGKENRTWQRAYLHGNKGNVHFGHGASSINVYLSNDWQNHRGNCSMWNLINSVICKVCLRVRASSILSIAKFNSFIGVAHLLTMQPVLIHAGTWESVHTGQEYWGSPAIKQLCTVVCFCSHSFPIESKFNVSTNWKQYSSFSEI